MPDEPVTYRTREKIFCNFFSLSPTHLLKQSEPLRDMNDTLRSELPHSIAKALATRVLPVPEKISLDDNISFDDYSFRLNYQEDRKIKDPGVV